MIWALRILLPWLASGAALGVAMWFAMNVNAWLVLPGILLAAMLATALFPPEAAR